MSTHIIESVGAEIPARRTYHDPFSGHVGGISARSLTPTSLATTIRPDIGESEAYKQALIRGEIGLQRPMGVNVQGVDFITAVRLGEATIKEILCTDVKTSQKGKFPAKKKTMPGSWHFEVVAAITRLKLRVMSPSGEVNATNPEELACLEREINLALNQNRIGLRQLNVDYSSTGQGNISGW